VKPWATSRIHIYREAFTIETLVLLLQVYRNDPERWQNIQIEGMKQDFSWTRAAASYERVIEECVAPKLEKASV
jgi:glycogen synthase